jgi:hypothetical protein
MALDILQRVVLAISIGVGGYVLSKFWVDRVVEPLTRFIYRRALEHEKYGERNKSLMEFNFALARWACYLVVLMLSILVLIR